MTQHYIKKDQTKFLIEQPLEKQLALTLSSDTLRCLKEFIDQKNTLSVAQKTEVLKNISLCEKTLSPLRKPDRYNRTSETTYSTMASYYRMSITQLKEVAIEKLTDSTPSKKIVFARYEKFNNIPTVLLKTVEKVSALANSSDIASYNFTIKDEAKSYYGHTTRTINLKKSLAEIKSFAQQFDNKIIPLIKSSYALKETDYSLEEFKGSLSDAKNFNVSQAYYLMGTNYKEEEGFIGIEKTSHSQGDLFRFKIVKDLANAFIFHKDMSKELAEFKPLVKVDVQISFKKVNSPGKNQAAQRVQSFVDKASLENAIAFITPQEPTEEVVPKKRHKI